MKILIAGGTGAAGRTLIPYLTEHGHDVTGTTRAAAKEPGLVTMDGLDPESVKRAIEATQPDVIVNQMTALRNVKMGKPDKTFAMTKQMGRNAARTVRRRLRGATPQPFEYKNKGNVATIGRLRAVADLPPGIHVGGVVAWALWLVIHLWYLIGFQNRVLVFLRWVWSFLTHGRGGRLIAGQDLRPG